MQQLKPSVIQPTYSAEWLRQLTWLHSDSTPWIVGLPLKVDPTSVTPPCYIYFQPTFSTIEVFKGMVRISPYPALDAASVVDMLEHLELEPIHQQTGVPKKAIAIRATQAIDAVRSIVEFEQKLRSS